MFAAPPDVHTWAHRPIHLCPSPGTSAPACDLGVPFPFTSKHFEGSAVIRVRGCPNAPPDHDGYFEGRRRKMQMTVKGRFLTPDICFASVLTGEALDRPLVGIGRMMTLVIRGVLGVVNRIMPALSYNFHSSKPYALGPMMGAAQAIHIQQYSPDAAKDMSSLWDAKNEPVEDVRLLGEHFVGMEAPKRRSYFNSLDNCKRFTFDPDHLYTFVFFQDLIDGFNFQLQVTGITIDLSKHIQQQPVHFMVRIGCPEPEADDQTNEDGYVTRDACARCCACILCHALSTLSTVTCGASTCGTSAPSARWRTTNTTTRTRGSWMTPVKIWTEAAAACAAARTHVFNAVALASCCRKFVYIKFT